jgi:hypothetical protein
MGLPSRHAESRKTPSGVTLLREVRAILPSA